MVKHMVDWIEYLCDVMEAWNQLKEGWKEKVGCGVESRLGLCCG